MKVIEQEIHSLKNSISEMWALVHQQLYNAGEAMLTGDIWNRIRDFSGDGVPFYISA